MRTAAALIMLLLSALPAQAGEDTLQKAELRFVDTFVVNTREASLRGGGEATLNNGANRVPTPDGIVIAFTAPEDPLLKECRLLLEKPLNTATKLSIAGYGTAGQREDHGSPVVMRLGRLTECKLVPAVDFAAQAAINAPSSNLWVASLKAGNTTFWLHYTGASASAIEKTRAMDRTLSNGPPGAELSCAEAWLQRLDKKTTHPKRLGQLELTVDGDAKSGAKAVKEYADAGSSEHIYMLGHLYYHGVGVDKDERAAYSLLRKLSPGGDYAGGPGINPWTQHYAEKDAEAVAAALTFDANGKRRKVDFKMPGEPGAPVTYGYRPFADKEPDAMEEPPPFSMPPMEESLMLYSYPYPEE